MLESKIPANLLQVWKKKSQKYDAKKLQKFLVVKNVEQLIYQTRLLSRVKKKQNILAKDPVSLS